MNVDCDLNYKNTNREKELEALMGIKESKVFKEGVEIWSTETSVMRLSGFLDDNRIDFESQVIRTLQSANALMSKLGAQLKPLGVVADETTPWR